MERDELLEETLYVTEFGSRLYGTQTSMSDLDLKFIFLPKLADILLGKQVVKSKFNGPNLADKSLQVDEDFIPLQKFAFDFLKGVPYAVEVAFSLDHVPQKAYRHPDETHLFIPFVQELRTKFLNKKLSGFLGFINQMKRDVDKEAERSTFADQEHSKNAYHGLRVAEEAFQLLTTRHIVFPFDKKLVSYFLSVKNGNEKLEMTKYVLDKYVEKVETALRSSTLPDLTPELEAKFESWFLTWLEKFYDVKLGG
jgi:hypothetical protein